MRKTFVSIKTVTRVTGLSRTTIWRRERAGDFPKRVQLSPGRVGWREDEVMEWIESRSRADEDDRHGE